MDKTPTPEANDEDLHDVAQAAAKGHCQRPYQSHPKAPARRESSDSEETHEEKLLIPEGMFPPSSSSAEVFSKANPWGNQFPIQTQFERFLELFSHKFIREQGLPEDQIGHWMVRRTIQQHNLSILVYHPSRVRSKDVVLEFIMNFKPTHQGVLIRGKYYPITPKVVVEALRYGYHHQSDEKICREWIKDCGLEASV